MFTTAGASQRFDREFWDAVFGGGTIRIGIANANSKEDNAMLREGLWNDLYDYYHYILEVF